MSVVTYFCISAQALCRHYVPEVSLECLWVVAKESVDQPKQLHDPLILPQVFMTLQ